MAVDLSAFRNKVNKAELESMEERFKGQNNGNFPELPSGIYAVELDKMEVGTSSFGTDQVNITFKITDGDHKGKLIFYNGTFDDHFVHGKPQTARLISEMSYGDYDKHDILTMLDEGATVAKPYILEFYQELSQYTYDLDYQVKESNKLNPYTQKPYVNKFFSITEVFDA